MSGGALVRAKDVWLRHFMDLRNEILPPRIFGQVFFGGVAGVGAVRLGLIDAALRAPRRSGGNGRHGREVPAPLAQLFDGRRRPAGAQPFGNRVLRWSWAKSPRKWRPKEGATIPRQLEVLGKE